MTAASQRIGLRAARPCIEAEPPERRWWVVPAEACAGRSSPVKGACGAAARPGLRPALDL